MTLKDLTNKKITVTKSIEVNVIDLQNEIDAQVGPNYEFTKEELDEFISNMIEPEIMNYKITIE